MTHEVGRSVNEESYIQQKSQSKNEHDTFQFVCALVLCVALRPAQAMVPPPLARVPQATFDNYRARMRQHFAIPAVLDTTRCIACLQPRTTSTAGEREHEKTGVCEACWDLLEEMMKESHWIVDQNNHVERKRLEQRERQ